MKIKKNEFGLISINSEFPVFKVAGSSDVVDFARLMYERPGAGSSINIFESFYVVSLNRNNNVIAYTPISCGAVAGTVVDSKMVAFAAVESLASHVVLVHNHPSGKLEPSQQDIALTKKIKAGLKLLDIEVIDHVIVTDVGHCSLSDEGRL